MIFPGATSIRDAGQSVLLTVVTGLAYFLSFRLNQQFDHWTLYAQGISLVFLPAGVKHLSILVARGWGALGCFWALMWLSFGFWSDISLPGAAVYSGISTLASWLGIRWGMRLLRIERDLRNLQFLHLPALDLLTTAWHGLVVNLYFLAVGMKQDQWLSNVLAMMFGDFTGSFIVLTLLWATLLLVRHSREDR